MSVAVIITISDSLHKVAVFEHANHPSATIVEQVEGFARSSRFSGHGQGGFRTGEAIRAVGVHRRGVGDSGEVEHLLLLTLIVYSFSGTG